VCTGILIQYSQIQFAYWLLFYSIVVWWSFSYPFSYKKAKDDGKLKHIMVATALIGFIMPSLVLVLAIDGFYPTNIVFNACSAKTQHTFTSCLHFTIA